MESLRGRTSLGREMNIPLHFSADHCPLFLLPTRLSIFYSISVFFKGPLDNGCFRQGRMKNGPEVDPRSAILSVHLPEIASLLTVTSIHYLTCTVSLLDAAIVPYFYCRPGIFVVTFGYQSDVHTCIHLTCATFIGWDMTCCSTLNTYCFCADTYQITRRVWIFDTYNLSKYWTKLQGI